MSSNWATVDMEKTFGAVIEAENADISEVCQKGFCRWMLEKETRTYDTPQWRDLCGKSQMRFDPKLQKRVSRKEMQVKAQKTHTGEERWTNVDRHFIEV